MKFELNGRELTQFMKWSRDHKCSKERSQQYTYCFSPTGIGTVVVVKCYCGQEINLTDSSTW